MEHRRYFGFLFLLVLSIGVYLWWQAQTRLVVFCDVGEGDGILIKDGLVEAVIDAGPQNGKMQACLDRFLPFFDRKIEFVFASHYDADHVGGFFEIFKEFKPQHIYSLGKYYKSTQTLKKWRKELGRVGVSEEPVIYGRILPLASGRIEVLYPFYDTDYSRRNLSLVVLVQLSGKSFLLGGDLEERGWDDLVKRYVFVEADVLKVSHHGSRNGLSRRLLQLVKPKEAVISVGKNSYGHPSPSVLELLQEKGIRIRRTDREGDIVYGPEAL